MNGKQHISGKLESVQSGETKLCESTVFLSAFASDWSFPFETKQLGYGGSHVCAIVQIWVHSLAARDQFDRLGCQVCSVIGLLFKGAAAGRVASLAKVAVSLHTAIFQHVRP